MNTLNKIILGILLGILIALAYIGYSKSKPVGFQGINTITGNPTSAVTVSNSTSTAVIAPNSGLQYVRLQNDGAFPVYCAVGTYASSTSNKGFRIDPAASSSAQNVFMFSASGDAIFVSGVNCIAPSGSSSVILIAK